MSTARHKAVYLVQSPQSEGQLRKPFAISALLHGSLITGLVLYHILGFEKPKPVIPTLRVDLVGLPDHLKNQTPSLAPPGGGGQEGSVAEKLEQARKEAQNVKTPKVAPPSPPTDEEGMSLASKRKKQKPQKQKENKEAAHQREERIKNALNRIKALSKIQESVKGTGTGSGSLIQGNQISRGNSLSGEAREGDSASYFDLLREHIQQNWELPLWLARKELSAKILLYLDSRGKVRKLVFTQFSGNHQFDEAVRKAVQASEPFPVPDSSAAYYGLQGIPIYFPL